MAETKSTENAMAADEWVSVPVITSARAKAAKVDPYLKPGTVTTKAVSYGGVSLPPLMQGVEGGSALNGEPKDYSVKVMWVNRRQIDAVLCAIEREQPELQTVLSAVRAFMCHLDSVRDEAKLGASLAKGALKAGNSEVAISNLNTVVKMLGRWNDEHRLYLH